MTANTSDSATREQLSQEQITDLRQQVSLFLDENVYPVENIFQKDDEEAASLMKDLQAKTKKM